MKLEVSAMKLNMPISFELLGESDIWICDTGASSHSCGDNSGAINVRESGSTSLGHAGAAVQATHTFDLLGMFVRKDGSIGLSSTLSEVNFSVRFNFNLLSLSRMLFRGGASFQAMKPISRLRIVKETGSFLTLSF